MSVTLSDRARSAVEQKSRASWVVFVSGGMREVRALAVCMIPLLVAAVLA